MRHLFAKIVQHSRDRKHAKCEERYVVEDEDETSDALEAGNHDGPFLTWDH